MQDNSEQITVKQAARMCSVGKSTIHRMVRTGKMPQTVKGFVPTAAVLEYKARLEVNRKLLAENRGDEHGGWEQRFDAVKKTEN